MFYPKKEIMRYSLSFMIIGEDLHRLFFDVSKWPVPVFNPFNSILMPLFVF